MLAKIVHQTDLTYDDLISNSAMELRMSPRQEDDQHRLSFTLAIGPPTSISSYFDWLGNTVHTLTINGFHRETRVVATSVVQTHREIPAMDSFPDTWPIARESLAYPLHDYLHFAGPVIDVPALRTLAEVIAAHNGEPLAALVLRMLHLVHDRFNYQKGITTSASPITEILTHGGGVCQDFTHLLIALARSLAIPARYVSGFVRRENQNVRGHAQTHAWCEIYFPSHGWIGVDPTNNCLVGHNFIKIAHGRDFRDVTPNKGVYRGTAVEKINVSVQIEELPGIPSALAAERFEPIDLDLLPHRHEEHLEAVTQQQEQQQQELRQQQEQQQQNASETRP